MRARDRWQADCERYFAYMDNPSSRAKRLKWLFLSEGLWALWSYRFGQYLHQEASILVRSILRIPYEFFSRSIGFLTGIHLFPSTEVGPGLYIGHSGNIWISPRAKLGARCTLSQGVTIGTAVQKAPVLGDRVYVGPNAVISGPVRVASGAVIAACSLVVTNVPENAVMIGVPAKVISYSGSARLLGPKPRGSSRTPEVTKE
jgi:serine O-acetyltransferase